MKIEKAIEILTILLDEEFYYPTGNYQAAIKLSIKVMEASLKDTVARRP